MIFIVGYRIANLDLALRDFHAPQCIVITLVHNDRPHGVENRTVAPSRSSRVVAVFCSSLSVVQPSWFLHLAFLRLTKSLYVTNRCAVAFNNTILVSHAPGPLVFVSRVVSFCTHTRIVFCGRLRQSHESFTVTAHPLLYAVRSAVVFSFHAVCHGKDVHTRRPAIFRCCKLLNCRRLTGL